MNAEELDQHLFIVTTAILKGNVTPLLGAGVSMGCRPVGYQWTAPQPLAPAYLPNGSELADHLAKEFKYLQQAACTNGSCPLTGKLPGPDLMQVSQSVEVEQGPIPLLDSLDTLFRVEYPISDAHNFLASIPKMLAGEKPRVRYQLIMTTNYDDLMEKAFQKQEQDYDLIWYQAEGENRGRFFHKAPNQDAILIDKPNEYSYPFFQQRPVILKLHGTVSDNGHGSYVITEDHYIEYTARVDHRALPKTLLERWVNLLYLGYSLRDYNLRVLVRRLQQSDGLKRVSWAVQRDCALTDQQYWQDNGVRIVVIDLKDYLTRLGVRLSGQGRK